MHTRSKATKRPARNRASTTPDHVANILVTIQNKNLPHRRRAAEARFCIKQGRHHEEALAVLREISAKPDKSIRTKRALDMVRRTLLRLDAPPPKPRPMLLPVSWKGLFGWLPRNHKYIPDTEWSTLSTEERFPGYVELTEEPA